jgi:hypothetical protein
LDCGVGRDTKFNGMAWGKLTYVIKQGFDLQEDQGIASQLLLRPER